MFRFFANRNHYSFADIGLRCDVHSHILPGVDDGAGEFADSVAILRAMHAEGVERFILTPHVSTMFPNKAASCACGSTTWSLRCPRTSPGRFPCTWPRSI